MEEVSRVIDPSRLRWVGFSHFEADECGALDDWPGPENRGFAGVLTTDYRERQR